MNQIFSIFAFVILCVGFTLGQAFVDIPITISDNAGGSQVLHFGLDPTATDGIDPALGESDLPPAPPLGVYDMRFWLPPFTAGALTSYRDYRNASAFPFTGPKEHRVRWQYSDFATALTFAYNLPDSVQITITSNNAVPVWTSGPRTGSGTYVLDDPDNSYTAARIQVVYNTIIPVELVSFGASVQGNSVNLSWQTATELNNSGFEIQRKSENSDWNKIGFVEGAGTTTENRSYSFSDVYSGQGTVSYRLKQIDFDGTLTYSKVVNVDINAPADFKLNQNYPNPFNPSTKIKYVIPEESFVTIKVYDMLGRDVMTLVNEVKQSGNYEIEFRGEELSTGMYMYRMEARSFISTHKMLMIK